MPNWSQLNIKVLNDMFCNPADTRQHTIPLSVSTPGQPTSLALELMEPSHPLRADAEAFVQMVFYNSYGANLDTYYPLLMGIKYPEGGYAAVAGIRPAGGDSLFSEHYLDAPVENILNVERENIVEIGNLAPASAGQARWLICTLTSFLTGAGFTQVVFTSVPMLKNAFRRMGLPLTKQADALQERLPITQQQDWGSYYENNPAVYSGQIRIGYDAFNVKMNVDPHLQDVSRRAFNMGQLFANQGMQP